MLFSGENLRKLIIPLLLEQALVICVGMADTMMVSSVGEAAISGVSLVDMVNNLIISILAALATGGSVVTSQYIGANRRDKACESARQLIVSAGVISVIITAVFILLKLFCQPVHTLIKYLFAVSFMQLVGYALIINPHQ